MTLHSPYILPKEWICASCTGLNTIHTYPYCTICYTNFGFHESMHMMNDRRLSSNTIMKLKQTNHVHIPCAVLDLSNPILDQLNQQDESNYRQLLGCITRHCQEFRTHFVDDEFPPIERSIGDKSASYIKRWLRINEINPISYADRKLAWTVFSAPLPSDIQQGALGNCWLVAAIALIIEYPKLLERILPIKEINKDGVYFVRVCYNGLWKIVTVDDCFPCTQDGQLIFTQAKRRQLYVPLIEKACAKIFGSYGALKSGTLLEGLQLLTGAPCDYIDLQPASWFLDGDIVWAKLVSACESKLMIGASSGVSGISSQEYDRRGIPNNHAFSILGAYEIAADRSKYVLVRDPHGSSAYQETSLTKEDLQILRIIHPNDRSSGAFWISWHSFIRYFSSITISSYKSNYFDIRKNGQFTQSATDPIQIFQFKVNEHSSIHISLVYHRQNRTIRNNHIQSFILCDLEKCFSSDQYIIGGRTNILISKRGGFTKWDGSLNPGTYMLIPFSFTFWYNQTRSRDYTAVIHTNNDFSVEMKYTKATILTDCLIASLLKHHDQKSESESCTVYFKSNPAEVCMLMFENHSSSEFLAVDVCFERNKSIQLLQSRSGHHIRDFIPPLHRQIVLFAEWENDENCADYLDYQLNITRQSNRSDSYPLINVENDDMHTPRLM